MPPVMMTGVRATARKPSSMLRRSTSTAFVTVRKFWAVAEKTATSTAMATSRILGMNHDRRERSRGVPRAGRVDRHGAQDDRAVKGALPIRADAEKRQTGPDGAKQENTQERAGKRPAAAGDRGAAHNNRRDDLHLQSQSAVAGNLIETHSVEHRRQTGQRSSRNEDPAFDRRDMNSGETRGARVRAGRVHHPA